jgi:hypothetical protein
MTLIDEYTAERRIRKIEIDGRTQQETTYPNLIGRLPIVHIPNNSEAGQLFGHPEAEALVEVLLRYGVVMQSAVEGNERQGRPTPVMLFETAQDMDAFWGRYAENISNAIPDGDGGTTTQTTQVLNLDLDQVLTLSGASSFKYEAPGSFSADTVALLGLMFYLILEHTELPEFVFGNAVTSSHASVETQLPVFIKYIEMRQADMRAWLIEIAEIALAYLSIVQPGITADTPALQYEPITDSDGNLTLSTLTWAYGEGLIDDRTALTLAPIDIEDIEGVLAQAKREAEERQKQFEQNPLNNDPDAIFRDEVNKLQALNAED